MNYIIHLTDSCNLNCNYCYENKKNKDISFDNIKKLIDYEISTQSKNSVITFYGGEPLLKFDFIKDTIDYIKSKKSKTKFYYGITTNGTLINDEFIKLIKENNFVNVCYSFDGMQATQDLNRITQDGKGTFDIVLKNAKAVLDVYSDAIAMMVVTKNNIERLSENVKYLISVGFKTINIQFNYMENWQDEDLEVIRKQYSEVAQIYFDKLMSEEDINIPLIDEKIKTYVKDDYNCNEDCNLGMKNINVGTDGNFYICMQFVNNPEYIIGNCANGIDTQKRNKIIMNAGKEHDVCKSCAINKRCKHTCGCKNYLATNDINGLSPLVCETERIIIEIADELAEKLYKADSKVFIQKFYNENYLLIEKLIDAKKKNKNSN